MRSRSRRAPRASYHAQCFSAQPAITDPTIIDSLGRGYAGRCSFCQNRGCSEANSPRADELDDLGDVVRLRDEAAHTAVGTSRLALAQVIGAREEHARRWYTPRSSRASSSHWRHLRLESSDQRRRRPHAPREDFACFRCRGEVDDIEATPRGVRLRHCSLPGGTSRRRIVYMRDPLTMQTPDHLL
jgi:hypothetical protein